VFFFFMEGASGAVNDGGQGLMQILSGFEKSF
jgi:dihydroxyacetone kinase-like predicted kinase